MNDELPWERLEQQFALDPDGLARLKAYAEGSEKDPEVRSVESPKGPVCEVRGCKLHSRRDPVQEARRFVRRFTLAQSSVLVLLGYGSGYVARTICSQFDGLMVVFEPSIPALYEGLQHGTIPKSALFFTDAERMENTLYTLLKIGDQGQVIPWKPSMRLYPAEHQKALKGTANAIERARIRDMTTQIRVGGWLDFYLTNLPNLAKQPGLSQLKGKLKGVPAVICAAGPSLSKNIQALQEHRDDLFIFSVNTATKAVAKAGIKPHCIISVESLDVTSHFDGIEWLPEVPAFLELTGHPALYNLPFSRHLPLSVDTSACSRFTRKIDPGHRFNAGFCVANAATSLAAHMGCDPIILIGQDLAYDGEKVYADGTVFEKIRAKIEDGQSELEQIESKKEIEKASQGSFIKGVRQATTYATQQVPPWGNPAADESDWVTATKDFVMFRDWYANASKALKINGHTIYNCTEGGAHIDGWEEIPLTNALETLNEQGLLSSDVRSRFEQLLEQDPTPVEALRQAVQNERRLIDQLLRLGVEARELVGHDPDGDITASPETTARLAEINNQVVELMDQGPLIREVLTAPLGHLSERQEMNTFTLHQSLEQHLVELDRRMTNLESLIWDESCDVQARSA